jgi:hypothetical protein
VLRKAIAERERDTKGSISKKPVCCNNITGHPLMGSKIFEDLHSPYLMISQLP